ncbi:MAG: DNA-directed RNA polymerase subunit beta' [Chloroflexi bacterium]|nr:DNA-directed RNA polymerase subunit beta' [Chloroflexota bacterium]
MLEVNDFNAVRISLASPEQIRSWSYGEVTKPETINYRTLKPEKDGLFCEKIFGPTKDWECYCGKYKRVRYKGIVCDKCGVEVARAKVRRERMGHIDLASPVSHIWFVKGTPSRIGLLLDVSPRSLERVLYFAQFIITEVDQDARRKMLAHMEGNLASAAGRAQKAAQEEISEINSRMLEQIAELEASKKATNQALEERLARETEAIMSEATALKSRLEDMIGQAAPEHIAFGDTVLIQEDAAVTKDHLQMLNDLTRGRIEEIEREVREDQADSAARVGGEIDHLRYTANEGNSNATSRMNDEIARVEQEIETQRKELEDLQRLQLISEGKYRELNEKYGKVFRAGTGAEAVRQILVGLDLNGLAEELRREIRMSSGSGQRRKKATKRLRVVEAFRKSGNRPEWMIFTVLPVLPPDLRPMVQLDGGRFATSDLNDLYRRVINRNNRLKRLLELGAPEIIIRNEKRMLQEAVDSLIDNGRRGRAVSGSSNHKLKSLSDMLKGKQGRFRQNLLGKRVDYSGRSVIVVGPDLKLHQCGLPKRMALELFKPFVMRRLVERGYAHNIKSAKRAVERVKPEVWEVLEDVIKEHPVLLNRAPTLHRLGIQAFEPVLIEGSAIQIHPLACAAFGADFDGDQMAVHVPLSSAARQEARSLMLSTLNLLSPSSGEPIVAPTLDMVLGCYYMTVMKPGAKGEGKTFANTEDARLAYDLGVVDLQASVKVRMQLQPDEEPEIVSTTVGRLLFNEVMPRGLLFKNETMDRKTLRSLVAECYRRYGSEKTAQVVDDIKRTGFHYATKSGITIAIGDIQIPAQRDRLLQDADAKIEDIQKQFRRGLITDEERYNQAVEIWTDTTEQVTRAVAESMDRFGSVYMMTNSGAKGNIQQLRQMAAMRGLMTAPSGRIIDLPIRSSFREGLTVLEYFISTHGARKGLADTAIRTADSGYLTRRLIDVAQDVIITETDCGTTSGIWVEQEGERGVIEPLIDRIIGRYAASPIIDPKTGEIIVDRNEEIDEEKGQQVVKNKINRVHVRSPLTCEARHGVCQRDYGRSLARGHLAEMGEAVGIIAAQSIGEPGTQLTMRTFHTGGIAGLDITSGLPRVEELFEARIPKGQALISEIDGIVEVSRVDEFRKVKVTSHETYRDEQDIPRGCELLVATGDWVEVGTPLCRKDDTEIVAPMAGNVAIEEDKVVIFFEDKEEREYVVPPAARLKVENGQRIAAGDLLTEGAANPQDILRILGREAVQRYLVDEVQKVYRSQGVTINDKHIEIIVRQMLRKVKVETPGDTELLPGELFDRFAYEDVNARVLAEGGEPATAQTVLLGVTKASLNTESFLAAASFQETTRVLTEAAIHGSVDHLLGLKENVIIGKLIPAGSGFRKRKEEEEKKRELLFPLTADGA